MSPPARAAALSIPATTPSSIRGGRRSNGGRTRASLESSSSSSSLPYLKTRDGENIPISEIGLGTIAWGDEKYGFNESYRETDLKAAYSRARGAGINFFDTAEVYGYKSLKYEQSSEYILSRCALADEGDDDDVVVGSKVFTIPWTNALLGGGFRLGKDALVQAGKDSVKRMNRPMDLWSIHFPFPSFSQEVLMSALEESLDLGLTKAVGVSNYNKEQLEKAYDILDKRGIPLASNQIEYSILNRKPEKDGLLQSCKDRDVKVVAYSPLKALKTTEIEEKYVIMNKLCDFIGQVNSGGKSSVSVMLNYCIAKGTIPIPGAKNAEQIKDFEDAMGWTLDEESLLTIDEKMDYLDSLK
jgi:aryl-alcohol dehydrogenase-like predicted oxidoreductase